MCFLHGAEYLPDGQERGWAAQPTTKRELAIVAVINQLTDKKGWEKKVFDKGIVAKWKDEAISAPGSMITEITWNWCIRELQFKAKLYTKEQLIAVLDSETRVVKSDCIVTEGISNALKEACKPLQDVPVSLQDWHPGSDRTVLNLVHPSMYPLIYGQSLALQQPISDPQAAVRLCCSGRKTLPDPPMGAGDDECYSQRFQWLPSEVHFKAEDDVQIISYINNLHPVKYNSLYAIIEKIISKAIPLWNKCLNLGVQKGGRRIDSKIEEWDPPEQDFANDDEYETWEQERKLVIPEPGDFDDMDQKKPWEDNHVDLRRIFGDTGLQIIVKLASVVLTPEKPEYAGGNWHLEGKNNSQLNELIAATAIYYYDCENVADAQIQFRQSTQFHQYGDQDEFYDLGEVYDQDFGSGGIAIQEIGKVLTRQGRMIAFPNVLQHRVDSFRLEDPTRPGHRRILVLWLVDPHCRIPSTQTISPQQKDWWDEQVLPTLLTEFPAEIAHMILDHVDSPMRLDEARKVRQELMEERSTATDKITKRLEERFYNFCEH